MTTEWIPFAPASSQNGVPRRLFVAMGIWVGRREEIRIPMKVKRAAATTPARTGATDAVRAAPGAAAPPRLLSRIFSSPHTSTKASTPSIAGMANRFIFPSRKFFFPSSAIANSGRYVFGFRFRKSKIIVRPGERPVENVDHETGVCAGIVGVSGENPPFAASAARFGRRPSATPFATRAWSAPSNPRTMTREGTAAAGVTGVAASAKRMTSPGRGRNPIVVNGMRHSRGVAGKSRRRFELLGDRRPNLDGPRLDDEVRPIDLGDRALRDPGEEGPRSRQRNQVVA